MADKESISSDRSVPQWMKNRADIKLDVDGAAFSPPAHDDSFFYIRYPVGVNSNRKLDTGLQSLSDAINDIDHKSMTLTDSTAAATNLAKQDFTKHTEPCKQFMTNKNAAPPVSSGTKQTKPFGTDDGFSGPGAACGSSIIRVAHQMVAAKPFNRGFTVPSFNNDANTANPDSNNSTGGGGGTASNLTNVRTETIDKQSIELDEKLTQSARYMSRRGSKSLPASPMGSPKTMRKSHQNPYFTGQFTFGQHTVDTQTGQAGRFIGGSWILSSLLGIQREAITASSTSIASGHISEEAEEAIEIPAPTATNSTQPPKPQTKVKPSELREMNFWSPTSM